MNKIFMGKPIDKDDYFEYVSKFQSPDPRKRSGRKSGGK
jgi:hypothetical protein